MRGPTKVVYPEAEDGMTVEEDEPVRPPAKPIVKEKLEARFTISSVVTATEPAIVDTTTNTALSQMEALLLILNKVERIEGTICGDRK